MKIESVAKLRWIKRGRKMVLQARKQTLVIDGETARLTLFMQKGWTDVPVEQEGDGENGQS